MLATTTGIVVPTRSGVVRSTSSREPTVRAVGHHEDVGVGQVVLGTAVTEEAHGAHVSRRSTRRRASGASARRRSCDHSSARARAAVARHQACGPRAGTLHARPASGRTDPRGAGGDATGRPARAPGDRQFGDPCGAECGRQGPSRGPVRVPIARVMRSPRASRRPDTAAGSLPPASGHRPRTQRPASGSTGVQPTRAARWVVPAASRACTSAVVAAGDVRRRGSSCRSLVDSPAALRICPTCTVAGGPAGRAGRRHGHESAIRPAGREMHAVLAGPWRGSLSCGGPGLASHDGSRADRRAPGATSWAAWSGCRDQRTPDVRGCRSGRAAATYDRGVIDLRLVRENPDAVRASQRARGADESLVDALLAADAARREAVSRADDLRGGAEDGVPGGARRRPPRSGPPSSSGPRRSPPRSRRPRRPSAPPTPRCARRT